MQNVNKKVIEEFSETVAKMLTHGFRFSVINNPEEEKLTIISCTKPDKIKSVFLDFNIFLSGKQKIVEKVFFYN